VYDDATSTGSRRSLAARSWSRRTSATSRDSRPGPASGSKGSRFSPGRIFGRWIVPGAPVAGDRQGRLPTGRPLPPRRGFSGTAPRPPAAVGCARHEPAGRPGGPTGDDRSLGRGGRRHNIAGLHADRLARMTGGAASQRIVPFRGTYRPVSAEASVLVAGSSTRCPSRPSSSSDSTSPGKSPVRSGLGRTPFGAGAGGLCGWDFSLRDLWETLSYTGFRTLARRNWRTGLSDLRGDLRRNAFVRALQHNVSCLPCAPNMWAGGTAGSGLRRSQSTCGSSTTSGSTAPTHAQPPATTASLARADEVLWATGRFLGDG
jgi:hypothetical protein